MSLFDKQINHPLHKQAGKQWKNTGLYVLIICFGLNLSACSHISVEKQATAKALVKQRDNIITSNALSVNSESTLNTYGLESDSCLLDFKACLQHLQNSLFEPTSKQNLALFAELFYAKAQQLQQSPACQNFLARPPIDPYYANAPIDLQQNQIAVSQTKLCIKNYRQNLHQAIRHSYAYLFYDELTKDSKKTNDFANNVVNEQDIQTLDIYNIATSDIIENLYQKRPNLYRNDEVQLFNKLADQSSFAHKQNFDSLQSNNQNNNQHNNNKSKPSQPKQVQVLQIIVDGIQLKLYLPNQSVYLQSLNPLIYSSDADLNDVTTLLPTASLRLNGLNSVSKRQGFGVSYVAQTSDRYTSNIRHLLSSKKSQTESDDPSSRIYPTGNLLLTGMILPKGDTLNDVLNSQTFAIHLHDPYKSKSVQILGKRYPMAGNFSASYGLWLNENQLNGIGYFNLLNRNDNNSFTLPKLFMLEPYDPNKRIIIMMHGLASSPATWVGLTNDIFNDEKLRNSYQVWQIFYPTNIPMIENRHQIQQLIETAYQQTDPSGQNPASQHSVIISHSMGALISRMMLSNDDLNQRLNQLDNLPKLSQITSDSNMPNNDTNHNVSSINQSNQQLLQDNKLIKHAYSQPAVQDRLQLTALKPVDTAVFISAPFQGTDYADRWFTRAIRKVIHLPIAINQTIFGNLSSFILSHELKDNPLGALFLQNGASQLSDKSSFITLTKDLNIADGVTYHSVIASNDDDIISQLQANEMTNGINNENKLDNQNDKQGNHYKSMTAHAQKLDITKPLNGKDGITAQISDKLSDGIVPYASSHLSGAKSETILSGGHSIHENPQTILLLRRILHEHLQTHPLSQQPTE